MANHKSAKKRAQQTVTRTLRNRAVRTRVKNAVRSFTEALASGDKDLAKAQLADATRSLRKAASKGVLHQATASRRVSRLVQAFNKASASPSA